MPDTLSSAKFKDLPTHETGEFIDFVLVGKDLKLKKRSIRVWNYQKEIILEIAPHQDFSSKLRDLIDIALLVAYHLKHKPNATIAEAFGNINTPIIQNGVGDNLKIRIRRRPEGSKEAETQEGFPGILWGCCCSTEDHDGNRPGYVAETGEEFPSVHIRKGVAHMDCIKGILLQGREGLPPRRDDHHFKGGR